MKQKINWEHIIAKCPMACKALYNWLSDTIHDGEITISMLLDSLSQNNVQGNEEKLFKFWDDNYFLIGVWPVSMGRYIGSVRSESFERICNDHKTRRDAVLTCIESGFELFEAREIEMKKYKTKNSPPSNASVSPVGGVAEGRGGQRENDNTIAP